MNASDLRIFKAVAECGGINRAAATLNTVQSNVTNRIRQLEEKLGAPLFERQSRGVTLTGAGRRLLPYADRILALIEDARRAVIDDGIPRGPLILGTLETTAAMRLSPFLAGYVAAYPDVEVSLRTGTSCELIQGVLEKRLEGAFVCGPVNHPDLAEETVFQERLVILAAARSTSLENLLRLPDVRIVVLRAGCSYRQRLEEFLARRGIVGLRILEFGTLEAIFGCVAAGLGITLLPHGMTARAWDRERVTIHEIPPADGRVETVFIRRRDSHPSSALRAFVQQVRSAGQEAAAE